MASTVASLLKASRRPRLSRQVLARLCIASGSAFAMWCAMALGGRQQPASGASRGKSAEPTGRDRAGEGVLGKGERHRMADRLIRDAGLYELAGDDPWIGEHNAALRSARHLAAQLTSECSSDAKGPRFTF